MSGVPVLIESIRLMLSLADPSNPRTEAYRKRLAEVTS